MRWRGSVKNCPGSGSTRRIALKPTRASASLTDLFRGRSQLLVYHFMFGPDYKAGCPSCSSIADGFDGFAVHLANHDVMLWAVSRAPLAEAAGLQASAWDGRFPGRPRSAATSTSTSTPCSPSSSSAKGLSNTISAATIPWRRPAISRDAEARACQARGHDRNRRADVRAREAGHERLRARGRRHLPHLLHLCARAGWRSGACIQWLDRAPKGRNETGPWLRRHDEYDKRRAADPAGASCGAIEHDLR